jgi:hypothetical protein
MALPNRNAGTSATATWKKASLPLFTSGVPSRGVSESDVFAAQRGRIAWATPEDAKS